MPIFRNPFKPSHEQITRNLARQLDVKRGIETVDISHFMRDVSKGSSNLLYNPHTGKAWIEVNAKAKSVLSDFLHEKGHSHRMIGTTGKHKINLPIYDYRHLRNLQLLMTPLSILSPDPSYAIPIVQTAVAAPYVLEEAMASKYAVKKMKELGISKNDIKFARKDLLKKLLTFWPFLVVPLLTAGVIKHRKGKQKVRETEKKSVVRARMTRTRPRYVKRHGFI
jgi:hypothetical protein